MKFIELIIFTATKHVGALWSKVKLLYEVFLKKLHSKNFSNFYTTKPLSQI